MAQEGLVVGPRFSSFEELGELIEKNGGTITVLMQALRDAHGAGRLGIHVRASISSRLRGMGLAHYPKELPEYQEREVRIYRQGGPVEQIVEAVLQPGVVNDELLREATGGGASAVLQKVRELVCY